MKKKKLNVSGIFLRECVNKFNDIKRNHLEAHKHLIMEHLQTTADEYFDRFRNNGLNIKDTDTPSFAEYIDTFGLEQKDELLSLLQQQVSYDLYEYLSQPKEDKWWTRLWNTPKEEKPTEKPKPRNNWWQRTKDCLKYAIPTALVVIGGIFGLKKDSNLMVQNEKSTPAKSIGLPDFQRFPMPKPTDYTLDAFIKKAQPEVKKDTITQEPKSLTNFYNYRLSQFIGAKKRDDMLKNMQKQIDSGKITLPADISPAHYLYAAEIYRIHGYITIAKTLNDVQKSPKAISPTVQSSLFRYVRLTGKKGEGVQQMRHGKQLKAQNVRM